MINKIKEFLRDFIYGITRSVTLDSNGIEMTLPPCYTSEATNINDE